MFSHMLLMAALVTSHAFVAPQPRICPPSAPSATTHNGTVCGEVLGSFQQDVFLGVPFTQSPIGDLRFRHPQSYQSKYAAYDATKQPASCPGYAGFDVGIGPMSEDCLYLNIIRPSGPSYGEEKLPVLVWIYGGGFDAGGVADPRFNMSYMVRQSSLMGRPVIAVALNYRVGGWGFLASKEVLADSSANIGLYDQRMALRWVQENIDAFGGDASRVTIWGESAGAFSVGYQLMAFDGENDGLFRAAMMDSGTALGQPTQNATEIGLAGGFQMQYDNVTATVGCSNATDSLQCLRAVEYQRLFDAFEPQVYTPVIDGDFIRRRPSTSFAEGKFANAAVLLGANTDEGTASFWGPRGTLNTSADVAEYIGALNGGGLNGSSAVDELLLLYPDDPAAGCPFNTGEERFVEQGYMYKRGAAIATDQNIHAGRRRTAELFAQREGQQRLPVYSYRFDQSPWNGTEELIATVAPVFSTHFAEVRSNSYPLELGDE